jgi:hypothetical protein
MCRANLVRSLVIDTVESQRGSSQVALAYFYCKRNNNEPDRQDPDAILRAIVKQLACLRTGLPLQEAVVREYNERKKDGFSKGYLQLDISIEIILELTKVYPQTTIILDALDECDVNKRDELIGALHHIVDNAPNLVKIFVSSRDDDDIVFQLEKTSNLSIKASDNIRDIERFVKAEISRSIKEGKLLRRVKVDENLKLRLITTLINGANGM